MEDLDHLQTIESEEVQPTEEQLRNPNIPIIKPIHLTGHPVRQKTIPMKLPQEAVTITSTI